MRRKRRARARHSQAGHVKISMFCFVFFYFSIIENLVKLVFKNKISVGEGPQSAFHSEKIIQNRLEGAEGATVRWERGHLPDIEAEH